jgi:signal-transduction protein with cAMP-binding, CBS, and nucleotidyltransferase domain
MKRISDIMSTKVETIQTSDSAKDAAKKMLDKNVSSLVVVDESGQSIGIITERDITRGVCTHDILSKEFKIHHLMTSPLTTINSNSSVEMAANLMLQKKVRHLIVKGQGNKTVGIVTATNFIDYLNEKLDPIDPNAKVLKTLKDEI